MSESPETSSYPASIDTWNTLTDKEDLAEASDINKLKNTVISTQTELGTDVAGSATDLKTRLAVSIGDDGGVKGGSSFPGTPVGDQLFTRTDEDKLYRRDTGDTAWVEIGGGGHTLISTTTVSSSAASSDIAITANTQYLVKMSITATSSSACQFLLRFNNDTGTLYQYVYTGFDDSATTDNGNSTGATSIAMGGTYDVSSTDYRADASFLIGGQASSGPKAVYMKGDIMGNKNGSALKYNTFMGGWRGSATVTSFRITASTGTYSASIWLYPYDQ